MKYIEADWEFQNGEHHDWVNNPACVSVLWTDHWLMYCMGHEL